MTKKKQNLKKRHTLTFLSFLQRNFFFKKKKKKRVFFPNA